MASKKRLHRAALLTLVVVPLVAAACQPTGSARCDAILGPRMTADRLGWTVDCTPDHPNVGALGQALAGSADFTNETVWIWPEVYPGNDPALEAIMWHEVGHIYGYGHPEVDVYAFCKMDPVRRDKVGWTDHVRSTTPQQCTKYADQ